MFVNWKDEDIQQNNVSKFKEWNVSSRSWEASKEAANSLEDKRKGTIAKQDGSDER